MVAGVRKSWSFSVGSVLGGGDPSSCLIKDGDMLGEGDVAVSFLISDGEVSSSDESGINPLSLSGHSVLAYLLVVGHEKSVLAL